MCAHPKCGFDSPRLTENSSGELEARVLIGTTKALIQDCQIGTGRRARDALWDCPLKDNA